MLELEQFAKWRTLLPSTPSIPPLNGNRELLRRFSDVVSANSGVGYRRVCTDLRGVGWRI